MSALKKKKVANKVWLDNAAFCKKRNLCLGDVMVDLNHGWVYPNESGRRCRVRAVDDKISRIEVHPHDAACEIQEMFNKGREMNDAEVDLLLKEMVGFNQKSGQY